MMWLIQYKVWKQNATLVVKIYTQRIIFGITKLKLFLGHTFKLKNVSNSVKNNILDSNPF